MKKYGLPKSCLLRKSRDFERVYRKGKRLYGDGFTLIYLRNEEGFNRLGISIHRRLKGAVRRNRIKRIVRESFRLEREKYPPDADIVMAVKPGFSAASPLQITEAVKHAQERGGADER